MSCELLHLLHLRQLLLFFFSKSIINKATASAGWYSVIRYPPCLMSFLFGPSRSTSHDSTVCVCLPLLLLLLYLNLNLWQALIEWLAHVRLLLLFVELGQVTISTTYFIVMRLLSLQGIWMHWILLHHSRIRHHHLSSILNWAQTAHCVAIVDFLLLLHVLALLARIYLVCICVTFTRLGWAFSDYKVIIRSNLLPSTIWIWRALIWNWVLRLENQALL